MSILTTSLLLVLAAAAEIVGCYLPYLWLRHSKSPSQLLPATVSYNGVAAYITSHGGGAHLCCLRWTVHHRCAVVALAGGWHQAGAN